VELIADPGLIIAVVSAAPTAEQLGAEAVEAVEAAEAAEEAPAPAEQEAAA
jgi:hypothetical protein